MVSHIGRSPHIAAPPNSQMLFYLPSCSYAESMLMLYDLRLDHQKTTADRSS